jgi:predicted HAD superfamily Cof-like phosphohydrolase
MDKEWEKVRLFHEKFNHPVGDKPRTMDKERARKRYNWMLEEINEFLEAVETDDIVEEADAMIDVIYFALGTLVEMGIKPDQLFEIVQNANMSKLWEDGKPHYAEDGKTIKPATWEDPHDKLSAVINHMWENNSKIS